MKKRQRQPEYINHDTDEQMEIWGFAPSILGQVITWIGVTLTLGFLRLIFYWKPEWMLMCTHRECDTKEATTILLRDKYQQWFVEPVSVLAASSDDSRDDLDSLNQSSTKKLRHSVSIRTIC